MAAELKDLSTKVKSGGLVAVMATVGSLGMAVQEFFTIETLTNTNTTLTIEYQALTSQITKFVQACNIEFVECNDKIVECWKARQ